MAKKDLQAMLDFLQRQLNHGRNWLTYDGIHFPMKPEGLRTFRSAIEATTHCVKDILERRDGQYLVHNKYAAIDNVIAEIRYAQTGRAVPIVKPAQLEKLMDNGAYNLLLGYERDRHLLRMSLGGISMCHVSFPIIPEEHISAYHIVGHQVVSTGQRGHPGLDYTRELFVTGDFGEAQGAFRKETSRMLAAPTVPSRSTFFIGRYKGSPLEYDEQVHIQRGSGIILGSMTVRDGVVTTNALRNPADPEIVQQEFFIRYDAEQKKLLTLGDILQAIQPGNGIVSYGGNMFVDTVNSAILGHARDQLNLLGAPRPRIQDDDGLQKGKRI